MATLSPNAVCEKILLQLDRVLDIEPDEMTYAAHAAAVEALVDAFVTLKELVLDVPSLADDEDDEQAADDDEDDDDEDEDLEDEEGEEDDDDEASDASLVLVGQR